MSIVGPRPAPPREVEEYDIWHRRRLSMKPGVTGLWQITSRLDEDFDQRAELDLDLHRSLVAPAGSRIVLRTVPALLRGPVIEPADAGCRSHWSCWRCCLLSALPTPAFRPPSPARWSTQAAPLSIRPSPSPRPPRKQRPGPTEADPKPRKTPKPTGKSAKVWVWARPPSSRWLWRRPAIRIVVGVPADAAAPLLAAVDSGFMADAGFAEVTLTEVDDPVAALEAGESAVRGRRCGRGSRGAGRRPLAAGDGRLPELRRRGRRLRRDRPGRRAGPRGAASPPPSRRSRAPTSARCGGWPGPTRKADQPSNAAFAPYDGGFGARKSESGWGELDEYLAAEVGETFDMRAFVSEDTLNLAQLAQRRKLNPVTDLRGQAREHADHGRPARGDAGGQPHRAGPGEGLLQEGRFQDGEVEDIEEPLLGVLQGDLDIAVLDTADALDGASQGLPLVARRGSPQL